jgi:hypothetical protein
VETECNCRRRAGEVTVGDTVQSEVPVVDLKIAFRRIEGVVGSRVVRRGVVAAVVVRGPFWIVSKTAHQHENHTNLSVMIEKNLVFSVARACLDSATLFGAEVATGLSNHFDSVLGLLHKSPKAARTMTEIAALAGQVAEVPLDSTAAFGCCSVLARSCPMLAHEVQGEIGAPCVVEVERLDR